MVIKRKFIDFDQPEKVKAFSDKNNVDVSTIAFWSQQKFIFECKDCGKDFTRRIESITKDIRWCPCCTSKTICKHENCDICYKKSFAYNYPEKARLWSSKNDISPDEVNQSSNKKFWFDCDKCLHSYESELSLHCGCRYCSNKDLCGSIDCKICYEKTCEHMLQERDMTWSLKNSKLAHEVYRGSHTKYWFDCKNCPHSVFSKPCNINLKKGCKYCANHLMCEDLDCRNCYSKSVDSILPKNIVWSSKNEKHSSRMFSGTRQMAFWECKVCNHEFCRSIVSIKDGTRCPKCRPNKAINTLTDEFQKHDVTFKLEEFLKFKNNLYWDVTVNTKWGVFRIESDGAQHFNLKNMMHMSRIRDIDQGKKRFQEQRYRDLLKDQYILDNDLLLFRVSYRQLKIMRNLAQDMLRQVEQGVKGVVYMDESLYNDWKQID